MTEAGLLEFFESLDEALIASREPLDPESLSALVLQSLDSQPQLPRLLSILHTMLEHNVDRLTVLKFREFLATRVNRSGRHLERRLPFLCPAQGVDLILLIHCLVLGTWQVSDSAPVVKACLDAPGLHIFDRPFGPLFSSSLAALVSGLRSQADSPDSAIGIPARS